ncbi:hypothetical protein Tco_0206142, partial [Tanacetum coccineum]
YPFDYGVTLGFGSIAGGIDPVGPVIQLLIKRGINSGTRIGILDAGGIFLYNTPNKAFKILENKVLLKLDFSDVPQMSPEPKTIDSAGGSNINPDYAILMEKIEAFAKKINSEFLNIRKELKEM